MNDKEGDDSDAPGSVLIRTERADSSSEVAGRTGRDDSDRTERNGHDPTTEGRSAMDWTGWRDDDDPDADDYATEAKRESEIPDAEDDPSNE